MDPALRQRLYVFAKGCGLSTSGIAGLCQCGGMFAAELDPPQVYHTMPMCKEFEEKEPDEYLAYLNRMSLN